MNSTFKQIESEFLKIEPFENRKLYDFYLKHKGFFDLDPPDNHDDRLKYFTMLCEIGTSCSFSEQHEDALKILPGTKKKMNHYLADPASNPDYNKAIFGLATSYFSTGYHFKALRHFKLYQSTDNEKNKINTLIKICKSKIRNKLLYTVGTIGLIILTFKHLVKWYLPEHYTPLIRYSGPLGAMLILGAAIGILSKK